MPQTGFKPLDDQPFKAFHWRAVFTTGMGVFTDGYDLASIGVVLPLCWPPLASPISAAWMPPCSRARRCWVRHSAR